MNKLAQQMVGYIEVTGKALGVATAAVKEAHIAKQAAGDIVPKVVDRMVQCGLIPEAARKQASSELGNHADSLEIMLNVMDEMNTRVKASDAKIAALNNGKPEGPTQTSKQAKSYEDDPDMALIGLVPGLRDRFNT
jgi:hypothetical protein